MTLQAEQRYAALSLPFLDKVFSSNWNQRKLYSFRDVFVPLTHFVVRTTLQLTKALETLETSDESLPLIEILNINSHTLERSFDFIRFEFKKNNLKAWIDLTVYEDKGKLKHFVTVTVTGTEQDLKAFQLDFDAQLFTVDKANEDMFNPEPDIVRILISESYWVPWNPTQDSCILDMFMKHQWMQDFYVINDCVKVIQSKPTSLREPLIYYWKTCLYAQSVYGCDLTSMIGVMQYMRKNAKEQDMKLWGELLFPLPIEENFTSSSTLMQDPMILLWLIYSASFGHPASIYLCMIRGLDIKQDYIPSPKEESWSDYYSYIFCPSAQSFWSKSKLFIDQLDGNRKKAQVFIRSFTHLSKKDRKDSFTELESFQKTYNSPYIDDFIARIDTTFTRTIKLKELLSKYPRHPSIYYSLACFVEKEQDTKSAVEYFTPAFDLGNRGCKTMAKSTWKEDESIQCIDQIKWIETFLSNEEHKIKRVKE
jgi:hypothetical protein